jgi:hypothetical protein
LINAAVPEMVRAGSSQLHVIPPPNAALPSSERQIIWPNINDIESSKSLQGIVATSAQRVSTPSTPFAPCMIEAVCSLSKHPQDLCRRPLNRLHCLYPMPRPLSLMVSDPSPPVSKLCSNTRN